jgi:hypothetical protein
MTAIEPVSSAFDGTNAEPSAQSLICPTRMRTPSPWHGSSPPWGSFGPSLSRSSRCSKPTSGRVGARLSAASECQCLRPASFFPVGCCAGARPQLCLDALGNWVGAGPEDGVPGGPVHPLRAHPQLARGPRRRPDPEPAARGLRRVAHLAGPGGQAVDQQVREGVRRHRGPARRCRTGHRRRTGLPRHLRQPERTTLWRTPSSAVLSRSGYGSLVRYG